jgi:hypothetical protein
MIPLGESVHFDVITRHPLGTGVCDADAAPTFEVFEEAADAAVVSGTMTKRTGKTGNYRGTFDATAFYGFEVGKFYNVVVSATVAGVADKQVRMTFRVLAAETLVGTPAVNVESLEATALGQIQSSVESTLTILPLQSTIQGSGRISPTYLTAYQDCQIIATITVVDSAGTAIDLSGKDISLVAWPTGDPAGTGFELLSTGANPELTIGGTSHNIISIAGAATHTATAGQFDYRIYNTTDDIALVDGVLSIVSGKAPT